MGLTDLRRNQDGVLSTSTSVRLVAPVHHGIPSQLDPLKELKWVVIGDTIRNS